MKVREGLNVLERGCRDRGKVGWVKVWRWMI